MDRIQAITRQCFNAIVQIRQADGASLPEPEVLHRQLVNFVDALVHRAEELGFTREQTQYIAYPVVALMDEAVLAYPGNLRQFWMSRPLQMHYFGVNTAGDGFFEKLEEVRRAPSSTELELVYFEALALGFQGRYRIRGGEVELAAVVQSVEQDLARAGRFGTETLSPHGQRPAEARIVARRDLPILLLAGGALVLALGAFSAMYFGIHSDSLHARQRIESLNR